MLREMIMYEDDYDDVIWMRRIEEMLHIQLKEKYVSSVEIYPV